MSFSVYGTTIDYIRNYNWLIFFRLDIFLRKTLTKLHFLQSRNMYRIESKLFISFILCRFTYRWLTGACIGIQTGFDIILTLALGDGFSALFVVNSLNILPFLTLKHYIHWLIRNNDAPDVDIFASFEFSCRISFSRRSVSSDISPGPCLTMYVSWDYSDSEYEWPRVFIVKSLIALWIFIARRKRTAVVF